MSMDLEVWSAIPFDLPEVLPDPTRWIHAQGQYYYDSGAWVVFFARSDHEPTSAILGALPGAVYVACVTLEPIGAQEEGYIMLEKTVRTLAERTGGVWVDPDGHPFKYNDGTF